MAHKHILDEALAFILKRLREENESLPPEERMGLRAYCNKYGIIAPEQWESIYRHETLFSEMSDGGASITGEEQTEET